MSEEFYATTNVLIVGGGTGGLVLVAICRKLNIHFLALERGQKITPQGAGIALSPNALRVLDQLGIYEEIVSQGQDLRKMLIYRNFTKWRELDASSFCDTFGYPIYSIERHLFHRMLYQAAGNDEFIRWNAKIDDLIDDDTQPYVTVRTTRGEKFGGKVVVGADGILSPEGYSLSMLDQLQLRTRFDLRVGCTCPNTPRQLLIWWSRRLEWERGCCTIDPFSLRGLVKIIDSGMYIGVKVKPGENQKKSVRFSI